MNASEVKDALRKSFKKPNVERLFAAQVCGAYDRDNV